MAAIPSIGYQPVRRELILERILDAPREVVFKDWLDCDHLAQWWGPNGFTNPTVELDPRPGGAIRVDMRGPDGVIYPMKGVFREIDEPGRIVEDTTAVEDAEGNPQLEVLNTITFDRVDGKTKLLVRAQVLKGEPAAEPNLEGMPEGWSQQLDRLEEHLKSHSRTEVTEVTEVTDVTPSATVTPQVAEPGADLKLFERFIGEWEISGQTHGPEGQFHGRVSYEWLEGGHFLVERDNLDYGKQKIQGIELIGHEKGWGESEPSRDLIGHFFDNTGNHYKYVWEFDGKNLTVWGGEKGSAAVYRATLSDDGDSFTGRWEWPGGGYEATGTRIKRRRWRL